MSTADITDQHIARLRRMVGEPSDDTYSDDDLRALIAEQIYVARPPEDQRLASNLNYVVNGRTIDLLQPTIQFDLNAAAAVIWEEKLAALIAAGTADFSTDGQNFNEHQKVTDAEKMLRYYLSRRRVKSVKLRIAPPGNRELLGEGTSEPT